MTRAVAVVAPLVEHTEASSVERVVEGQLACLLDADYPTVLVAAEGFTGPGAFADPRLGRVDAPRRWLADAHARVPGDELLAETAMLTERLRPACAAAEVVLTHDVLLLPEHLGLNLACRALADELPALRWLHWLHSAPVAHQRLSADDPRAARFTAFPHGRLVYPSRHDAARVAEQFGVPRDDVAVVPHAVDLASLFGFHDLTRALVRDLDLYAPAVLAVYPARLDRVKRHDQAVRFVAELKALGQSVCLIVVAFHSIDAERRRRGEELLAYAAGLGLSEREIVVTNELARLPGLTAEQRMRYAIELPRRVIADLLLLSNVYVHPSASESFSLTAHEAAACRNLLVLSEDAGPMRGLFGRDALYARLSSPGLAPEVAHRLATDGVLAAQTRIRRALNPAAVFRQHLEPLLVA